MYITFQNCLIYPRKRANMCVPKGTNTQLRRTKR
nr:MAG TPA: hypothetical protein [Caudoviricetes sp.]